MPNYGTVLNTLRGLFTNPVADLTQSQWRANGFNEGIVSVAGTPLMQLTQDGRVWTAMNATIGTGLAHALVTAFSSTAALFTHVNNGPNNVFPWSLKLRQTATAPATGVSQDFLFILDSGARTPTANNVGLTVNNANPGSPRTSGSVVTWATGGSLTVPAAVNAKNIARCQLPSGVAVALDGFSIQFGQLDNSPKNGGAAVRATDPALTVGGCAPICIPPGYTLIGYRWGIAEATNAPSYELEYTFIE